MGRSLHPTPLRPWEVVVAQWEDLINLSAFQMVHGPLRGYLRFRYLRFGTPESEPVPAGLDFTKPFPLPIFKGSDATDSA